MVNRAALAFYKEENHEALATDKIEVSYNQIGKVEIGEVSVGDKVDLVTVEIDFIQR